MTTTPKYIRFRGALYVHAWTPPEPEADPAGEIDFNDVVKAVNLALTNGWQELVFRLGDGSHDYSVTHSVFFPSLEVEGFEGPVEIRSAGVYDNIGGFREIDTDYPRSNAMLDEYQKPVADAIAHQLNAFKPVVKAYAGGTLWELPNDAGVVILTRRRVFPKAGPVLYLSILKPSKLD